MKMGPLHQWRLQHQGCSCWWCCRPGMIMRRRDGLMGWDEGHKIEMEENVQTARHAHGQENEEDDHRASQRIIKAR